MVRSYGETGGPLRAELNTLFGCFFSGFCPHGAGSHILRNFSGISARMHLRAVGLALPGCVRAVHSWLVLVSFCFSGRAQKLLQHAFCAAGQTPFSALSKGTIFRQAGSWRSSPQRTCSVGRTASYSSSKFHSFTATSRREKWSKLQRPDFTFCAMREGRAGRWTVRFKNE